MFTKLTVYSTGLLGHSVPEIMNVGSRFVIR